MKTCEAAANAQHHCLQKREKKENPWKQIIAARTHMVETFVKSSAEQPSQLTTATALIRGVPVMWGTLPLHHYIGEHFWSKSKTQAGDVFAVNFNEFNFSKSAR